jgi:hypothetical protein
LTSAAGDHIFSGHDRFAPDRATTKPLSSPEGLRTGLAVV